MGVQGMKDEAMTKEQLTGELARLSERIVHLEQLETQGQPVEVVAWDNGRFNLSLLGSFPNPILVIKPDTSVRYANPSFKRLTGFSSEEVIGKKPPYPWWTEGTVKETKRDFKKAMKKGGQKLERLFQKKNGEKFWVEITSAPVKDNGEFKYFLANWVDITDQKQAEDALQESEAQKKAILDASIDRIRLSDTDFKIIWANETHTRELNIGTEDLEGKCCYKIFANRDSPCPECPSIKALKSGKIEHAVLIRPQSGGGSGKRYLDSYAVPITNKSGDIVYIMHITRDITARTVTEQRLRESEVGYRELADSITDVFFAMDRDLRYSYWNKASEELTGIASRDALGRSLFEIFPDTPETREAEKAYLEVLKTQKPRSFVNEYRLGGKKFFFEINAYPSRNGLSVFVKDITKRKKAEEELRESEAKYRELVQNANSIIIRRDPQGTITFFNEFAQDFFGYTEDAILGKNIIGTIVPETEATGRNPAAMIQDIGLHPERYATNENENMRRNGERVWVAWTNKAIRDKDGNISEILCIGNDITERKFLQSQLEQAERIEAIATLAGGIAHDFNNILSLIIGYTELVLDEMPKGSQLWEDLREVYQAAKRARDLVKQILVFSRQHNLERKPMKLHFVVTDALKLLRSSLPATIEIREHLTATGMVLADPTQIEQVIMNLCTNAYHAMRERGGLLEVRLEEVVLEGEAAAHQLELPPGPYVTLTVRDTGHGMSGAVMDHIFEPYFTTKGTGEGTGMGLARVHGIVKGHGGAITVDSAPDKGATFQVFLPRTDGAKAGEEPRKRVLPSKGTERMLFVDDEQAIIEMGRRILERLGYEVVTSTSGTEALEAFRAQPEKFDLVITDMTMPEMSGDEFATQLMRIRPEIPIILCTGFSERITKEKAKEMGIRKFIMKPLVTSELAEAVREVLDALW
jgi:PAS domain S-box-containing protein